MYTKKNVKCFFLFTFNKEEFFYLFSPTQDFENLYLPNCLYLYFLSGFNNHYMFAHFLMRQLYQFKGNFSLHI